MTGDLIARVQQHTAYFDQLQTFQQVAHWDAAAASLASELDVTTARLRAEASHHDARAGHLCAERARLPFFTRLFTSRAPERQARAAAASLLQ